MELKKYVLASDVLKKMDDIKEKEKAEHTEANAVKCWGLLEEALGKKPKEEKKDSGFKIPGL